MKQTFEDKLDDVLLRVQRLVDLSESSVMKNRRIAFEIPPILPDDFDAKDLFITVYSKEKCLNAITSIKDTLSPLMVNNFTSNGGITQHEADRLHDDIKYVLLMCKKISLVYEQELLELYIKASGKILANYDITELYERYPSSTLALSFPIYLEERTRLRMAIMAKCVGYTAAPKEYYNLMISSRFYFKEIIKKSDIRNKFVIEEMGSAIYTQPKGKALSVSKKSIKLTETIIRKGHHLPKIHKLGSKSRIPDIIINPVYFDGESYYITRGVIYPYMVNNEFAIKSSKFFDELLINNDPIVPREFVSITGIKQGVLDNITNSSTVDEVMEKFRKVMDDALERYIKDNSIPNYIHSEIRLSFLGDLFVKSKQLGKEIKKNVLSHPIKEATKIAMNNLITDKSNIFILLESKRRFYR